MIGTPLIKRPSLFIELLVAFQFLDLTCKNHNYTLAKIIMDLFHLLLKYNIRYQSIYLKKDRVVEALSLLEFFETKGREFQSKSILMMFK